MILVVAIIIAVTSHQNPDQYRWQLHSMLLPNSRPVMEIRKTSPDANKIEPIRFIRFIRSNARRSICFGDIVTVLDERSEWVKFKGFGRWL